jgi:hypothetical protein
MRAANQDLETAARIGCDPRLVRHRQLPAGRDGGGFDALSLGRRDSLRDKDRDRRETILLDGGNRTGRAGRTPSGIDADNTK